MIQIINNNNPGRRKPGRPKAHDNVKPIELSECLFCFHVYNRNNTTLQQVLIQDKNYCPGCFENEIMNKEYHDPIDKEIKELFWSEKIYYGNMKKG